ncbi:MAG TPA: transposase, partial [Geminicoccaceae bacterium]|nr:transposase [Geminicoccaceae bacterium]
MARRRLRWRSARAATGAPATGRAGHVDETFVRVDGNWRYLYRAVDGTGQTIGFLLGAKRDKRAAKRLLRKLLKKQSRPAHVLITDKLASYPLAKQELMPGVGHRRHKGLNNRADNPYQPTRRRERQVKRFKSSGQAQRFLSAHDRINNLFQLRRDHLTATEYRAARAQAFAIWAE